MLPLKRKGCRSACPCGLGSATAAGQRWAHEASRAQEPPGGLFPVWAVLPFFPSSSEILGDTALVYLFRTSKAMVLYS